MCAQVLSAVTGKRSVETGDHRKNGASPKSLTSRGNFLKYLMIAALAVSAAYTSCNKDSKSEPKTFIVQFDCNGGSAVSVQTVTEGEKATEPTTPIRTGYTFAGWYTDNGTFDYKWDFSNGKVSKDMTLYAKWTEDVGIGADQIEIAKNRYAATPVEAPDGEGEIQNYRIDYSFRCNASNLKSTGGPYYDIYYVYLGKVEWVPIYSMEHDYYYGSPFKITYELTETYQSSITTSLENAVANTVNTIDTHSDTYAWNINAEASFGGGNTPLIGKLFQFKVSSGFSHDWTDSKTTGTTEQTSTKDTQATFESWTTTHKRTVERWIGNIGEPVGYYRIALFATCDVYAPVLHDLEEDTWWYEYSVFAREDTYFRAVDYSATPEFGTSADAVRLKFDPSIVKILAEKIPDFIEPDAEIKTFTVTFLNGSDVHKTQLVEDGEYATVPSPNPTRENFKFTGWSLTEGGSLVNLATLPITADTKLYAQFEPLPKYKVTFMNDDVKFSEQDVQDGSYAKAPTPAPTPESNYQFLGWSIDKKNVINLGSYKITKDETFYAVFSYIDPFASDMVLVPGGKFRMMELTGTSIQGMTTIYYNYCQQEVTLSSYYIGKYEVTQAQWKNIMGDKDNPSGFKSDNQSDRYPVENVSWNNIVGTPLNGKSCFESNGITYYDDGFLGKLYLLTGKKYRLPTEAEWEYAARGGNKSNNYTYSGNNTIGNVAWYSSNSNKTTHPVGTKDSNELGIYDMSGNVWEWCGDRYGAYSDTYTTVTPINNNNPVFDRYTSKINPTGPISGNYRVFRGGSWPAVASQCSVDHRDYKLPTDHNNTYGFRVVL